jgi:hypothetical protein
MTSDAWPWHSLQAPEVAATQLTSIRQLNTSDLSLATDDELKDVPASDRLATPDVRLAAKGVEGEPPMPNAKEDLAYRHNTKSALVTLQGHDFEL